MSNANLLQKIKEARRNAWVNYYISHKVPPALQGRITNPDSLYEYLLLDTKISDLVKTTPVAEAISSLQLFIHRCVEGHETGLATGNNRLFAEGQFLYNWDKFNKRYSTWAGKERLKYYAGSYIDPQLRLGKTDLFLDFENNINQGRLTEDSVKTALQSYLTEYEKLADLEYISANRGDDESTLFFVARTKAYPYEYYWRRLRLRSNHAGRLVPEVWSQWQKITANIGDAKDKYVIPFWKNNRLHVQWINIEKVQSGDKVIDTDYLITWSLNNSGMWKPLSKNVFGFEITRIGENIEGNIEIIQDKGKLIFSYIIQDREFRVTISSISNLRVNINFEHVRGDLHHNEVNQISLITFVVSGNMPVGNSIITYIGEQNSLLLNNISDEIAVADFNNYNLSEAQLLLSFRLPNAAYGSILNNSFIPPIGVGSQIDGPINLTLGNNIDLSNLLTSGHSNLFSYEVQRDMGGLSVFSGPYGLYLWEIFFHIPFLVAVRFLNEQRYEYAQEWLRFIFNSTGYRDENGNLLTDGSGQPRYWNVVPLQESNQWNDTLSMATTNPDEIAMADPIHYRLAVFLCTLDYFIRRGDDLFRQLERDTLTEAKMLYIQANQLLGARPEIPINNNWTNPALISASNGITVQPTLTKPTEGEAVFKAIKALSQLLQVENGPFLPPYNDSLLNYWDKIELRLFNLRHNLSLDGQPLNLPAFATPVNPRQLQIQMSQGNGIGGREIGGQVSRSNYRFPLVIEKARAAVNQLIQFGGSLQNALQSQDNEAMTLLLQTQQQTIISTTREIQERNIAVLEAQIEALELAKEGAESSQAHFVGLLGNWMSTVETKALSMRSRGVNHNVASSTFMLLGAAVDLLPNTFGFAFGGSRWGAPLNATAHGLQARAVFEDGNATNLEISESYKRRMEDWTLQRDTFESEVKRLSAEIKSLKEQLTMAHKQVDLTEIEFANAQAIYELQSTRFTSEALYNWLTGRLSTLYYQMYDATLPLCMMAKSSLEQELGTEKAIGLFTLPTWNDLYKGLLAGEKLMVELHRLENIWLEENKRGLEVTKTVSMDTLIKEGNNQSSFNSLMKEVLGGNSAEIVNGVAIQLQNNILSIRLDLSQLNLNNSYNQFEKTRLIKNLSVTLPTLLGPYQDIEAILSLNGEMTALSHGMDDSGLFVTDFNDSRFLPFEGMDPTQGILQLSILNADSEQLALLKNLNDVIFHIRYIIR